MRPRLTVFRSNKYFYAQLILDGKTVASVNKVTDVAKAAEELAKNALKLKIKKIVFDRNGLKYHGKVKLFADSVRKGGLEF